MQRAGSPRRDTAQPPHGPRRQPRHPCSGAGRLRSCALLSASPAGSCNCLVPPLGTARHPAAPLQLGSVFPSCRQKSPEILPFLPFLQCPLGAGTCPGQGSGTQRYPSMCLEPGFGFSLLYLQASACFEEQSGSIFSSAQILVQKHSCTAPALSQQPGGHRTAAQQAAHAAGSK